jgi:hypothetical protein
LFTMRLKKIRAADAKEVGVGNPAEETCCYPNYLIVPFPQLFVNKLMVASRDCRHKAYIAPRRQFAMAKSALTRKIVST